MSLGVDHLPVLAGRTPIQVRTLGSFAGIYKRRSELELRSLTVAGIRLHVLRRGPLIGSQKIYHINS